MKPIGQTIFTSHIQKILTRKPKTRAKNYMQELTEPYLRYINWENDTLMDDMRLFWSFANRVYKARTETEYLKLLGWIKKKNTLYPRQVIKLFRKEIV